MLRVLHHHQHAVHGLSDQTLGDDDHTGHGDRRTIRLGLARPHEFSDGQFNQGGHGHDGTGTDSLRLGSARRAAVRVHRLVGELRRPGYQMRQDQHTTGHLQATFTIGTIEGEHWRVNMENRADGGLQFPSPTTRTVRQCLRLLREQSCGRHAC